MCIRDRVVVVAGYNDKLPLLLQSVLDTLTQLVVDEKRFAIVMDQVRRNYQNFDMEEPYQHVAYYSLYLLTEQIWTQHEKLAAMDGITAADVQAYIPWVCEQLHVEMLVHGNVDAAQAEALLDRVVSHVDAEPLPERETLPPRSLLLAPGSNSAWKLPVANPGNVNSSLEYYVQVGDPTDVALRATLALFAQIAHEPCFDQLRTKEQLGYLVFSGVRRNPGAMGFRVIVQSERDSDYLESRIDAFFDQLRTLLRNLTPEEFAAHKRSLIHKKRESVKNLAEETNRFWMSIHSGYYDFLSRERDIEARERDLEARTDHLRRYGRNNWPPFYPVFYHDIPGEIPPDAQPTMTAIYYLWLVLVGTLVVNAVACVFLFVAHNIVDGLKDLILGFIYLALITAASFFLWYRPVYYGLMKEHSLFYYVYFLFCGFHLLFSAYAFVGPPGTGCAGIVNMIDAFQGSHWAAGVLALVATIGFLVQGLGQLWFFRVVRRC